MNIAVIAANGRSGMAFVERALAAGHTVRAGIHSKSVSFPEHQNLTSVPCDATDANQVEALIRGQDAVVSFIGHVKGSSAWVQTDAMRVLVAAMRRLGMRRIVSLTGTGVRFPGDRITPVDFVLNTAISIIDPARIKDGKEHGRVLQESGLDWTIIRVLKLQNVSARPFSLKAHGPTKWYVSRKDVAAAVISVLEDKSFVGEGPILSRGKSIRP